MSTLPNPQNEGAPGGQSLVSARRRMLRIGAGTAPVVLTLLSRPVLGAQCMTTSAVGSTMTSLAHRASVCSGLTVSSWMASTTWPNPYKKTTKNGINGWDATQYHCLTTGLNGTTFTGKSMLGVMNLSDNTSISLLGRYIAAALLNARSGRTPVLSETTVRGMWNAYLSAGFYEPTAGVHWGPSEIVAYIESTMG